MATGPRTSLGAWLAAVAARSSAPGGGAAAAVTLATAASLGAMVARFSADMLGEAVAGAVADDADGISARALGLAAADEAAVEAMLRSRPRHDDDKPTRPAVHETAGPGVAAETGAGTGASAAAHAAALAAALRGAEVPLEIVALAAELVPHLRRLVAEGNPRLAGDALTGVELARAAGRAAAGLAAIDADALPEPERGRVLDRLAELRATFDAGV